MRNKRAFVSFLVVGALVAASGVAAASDDTVFNYGYDEDNRLLLINTTPWEDPESDPDCQFDTDLEDEEGTPYDVNYGDTTEADDVTVGDADCELQTTDVTGPAGQINHGMFMKAINEIYDGPRRGCVIRHLAQSDLGKDDQQVLASDAEADPDFEVSTSSSTVEFFSAHTDCERDGDNGETAGLQGNGNGNGKGKGRPDSPGNSGSAPGRDR